MTTILLPGFTKIKPSMAKTNKKKKTGPTVYKRTGHNQEQNEGQVWGQGLVRCFRRRPMGGK
jgi:hypothetical protein